MKKSVLYVLAMLIALGSCSPKKVPDDPDIPFDPDMTPVSITISGKPKKTAYFANDRFDPEGITVRATYDDNSTAVIPNTALAFMFSFTMAGADITATVSVAYEGITETVEINGITVVEPEESEPGPMQKILNGYKVRAIAFDSKGNAYIQTQYGHIRYTEKETTVYIYSPNAWDGFAVDKMGNVWAGVSEYGVWKIDGRELTRYNTRNSAIPQNIVWSIAVDSKNNIWMASCRVRLGGLAKYDGTNWTVYTPNNSVMPVNMIHGIAIDQSDNVWVALSETVGHTYLIKISNDEWDVYDENDFGFPPFRITTNGIRCDFKNRVWAYLNYSLASSMGPYYPSFFIFDGKTTIQMPGGADMGSLRSGITIDHDDYAWIDFYGELWIGEQSMQIDRSDFGGSYVSTVKMAPDHRIWFGTENGVYIQDLENIKVTNNYVNQ